MNRIGYEWISTDSGGFWRLFKGSSHNHKLDFFCQHCRKITGSIDDKYLEEFGFCAECYVMHVENKTVPTIDLQKYKK